MPRKQGGGKTKAVKIQIGNHAFTFGKGLSEIDDSTELYKKGDFEALRWKLETIGYVFVRSVIPKQTAQAAREMMLKQAALDGSVINTKDVPYDQALITKMADGKSWNEGYCVDGITGSETNERENIDEDAWLSIGPSKTMKDVYAGDAIKTFWKNLFGKNSVNPLVKQTFLRLMGDSGTQEHADYYYFKKDTHIFSGNDGRNAINALKKYKIENNLPLSKLDANIVSNLKECNGNNNNNNNDKNEEILFCHICEKSYFKSSLDDKRRKRYEKGGFGIGGEWHCPSCAIECFGIYTTWISLSELTMPKDSILALCPKSHNLKEWDIPKPKDRQLCNDFNWKMPWVIPTQCGIGDIIIFNIKTIHASSLNATHPKAYRVSCDTRILLTTNDKNENEKNGNRKSMKSTVEEKEDGNNNNYQTPQFGRYGKGQRVKKYNPSPHPPLSVDRNAQHSQSKDEEDEDDDNDNDNDFENVNDNTNANYFGNNRGVRAKTRAQFKAMMQHGNIEKQENNLKRATKHKDKNTDQLTSSMSDLNLLV